MKCEESYGCRHLEGGMCSFKCKHCEKEHIVKYRSGHGPEFPECSIRKNVYKRDFNCWITSGVTERFAVSFAENPPTDAPAYVKWVPGWADIREVEH